MKVFQHISTLHTPLENNEGLVHHNTNVALDHPNGGVLHPGTTGQTSKSLRFET